MRNHTFKLANSYPVALLIKPSSFNKDDLIKNYVEPLKARGLQEDQIFAMTLEYGGDKKVKAATIKAYVAELLPELKSCGVEYLLVADTEYFKYLVKRTSAESCYGYVLPCAVPGYEDLFVVLSINYQAVFYDPKLRVKLDTSLSAVVDHMKSTYVDPGTNIIHKAVYPKGIKQIKATLEKLMIYPVLAADIEAFSLRFHKAGIGTIAFAPDEHNFVAFPCDYQENLVAPPLAEKRQEYGRFVPNAEVRAALKWFFENYQGKLIWHRATYDVKVIIYTLWMKHPQDMVGLLEGLEVMTRHMDDTLIIAYLALNSTSGNKLGLKFLAHEFAGNWAVEEINDIRMIPLPQLLQYNGVDTLSTNYVYKKYWPVVIQDEQDKLYHELMLPTLKVILQMELVGMPMDKAQIGVAKQQIQEVSEKNLHIITTHPLILHMDLVAQTKAMNAANAKLKTKQHPLSKFADVRFNPGSDPQVRHLLYEVMQLPVIDLTKSKLPATGGKTIAKLLNHVQDPSWKELLEALRAFSTADKILTSFIPAFEEGFVKADDGMSWLHGSFNLGGTLSGRLSSSDPNLQNLPSGSTFGKLIKTVFKGPPGWIFAGADFSSLEDRINALLTRDPNKLIIYEQGIDSHAFRAVAYFPKEMPGLSLAQAGERFFEVTTPEGEVQYIKCGTLVSCPNGQVVPVEQCIDTKENYGVEKNS